MQVYTVPCYYEFFIMNVVQLLYYECSSAIMNVVQTVGTISTSFHVIYQGFLRIDKTNPVYTPVMQSSSFQEPVALPWRQWALHPSLGDVTNLYINIPPL